MVVLTVLSTQTLATPAIATAVVGDVSASFEGAQRPVSRFDEVEQGATVRTGERSRVSLRFSSGSILRIGPQSDVAVTVLEHREPVGRRREGVRVTLGRVWLSVTSLFGQDSSFEASGPNAVCGVRGTSFFVLVDEDGRERVVLEDGSVDVDVDGTRVELREPDTLFDVSRGDVESVDGETIAALKAMTGGFAAVVGGELDRVLESSRGGRGPRRDLRLRRELNGQDDLSDSSVILDDLADDPGVSGPAQDLDVEIEIIPPP
ncbi:MAG: FecR family protein [Myxococcota bacterium]